MQPDHNVASRYGYDRIDGVDVPDPQTVVVRYKDPFAPWATLFDVVLPQHILEKEADFNNSPYHQKPVGFGPFKVTENIKGDHTTYDAFDGYWRGRPKIDRLFIRYFGNTDAELQALKAKEIDLAWGVPLSSIPELQGLESQGITTLVQPGRPKSATRSTWTTRRYRSSPIRSCARRFRCQSTARRSSISCSSD